MCGIGYTPKQASLLVKRYRLTDYFKLPYKPSLQAKQLNNGVIPPNSLLITKYRSFQ